MVVEVDGERLVPYFYALTHSYAGRKSWEPEKQAILRQMHEAGVRLFQVDVYFEDIWLPGRPELDMTFALDMIRGVQTAAPGGLVVVRIHTNAPFWWNEAHPEEWVGFADGPVDHQRSDDEWSHEAGDLERSPRPSMASRVWRQEAGDRLTEFLTRLQATPEAQCVIGFHVASGIFGEWHYWGGVEHEPDTGPTMTAEFRRWLEAKYGSDAALAAAWRDPRATLASAEVPDMAARTATTLGGFRSPADQRPLFDYTECQMDTVVDAMEGFCQIVRRTWPTPTLVGVFYGYFHMMFCRHAVLGHLRVERVLDSPWIDYYSAPQSYWGGSRDVGGSGLSRGVVDAATRAGKLWLDEVDHGQLKKGVDDPEYLAITRRSTVAPLLRGQGHWLYDFGIGGPPMGHEAGGWWGGPKALAYVREEVAAFQAAIDAPRESVADVLVLWDYDSAMLPRNGWSSLVYGQLDSAAEDILRAGAAVEEHYLFELEHLDVSRYRAVVFGNTHLITPSQLDLIRRKLAGEGRWLIFSGYPGLCDGKGLDPQRIADVTGIGVRVRESDGSVALRWHDEGFRAEFKELLPAIVVDDVGATPLATDEADGATIAARKELAGYCSVLCTEPITGPAVFRSLFRQAGCHLYCEDGYEPVWADSRHVLLHTATGGERKVRLRNGAVVSVQLPGPATLVLDAQTGEAIFGDSN
jgi:hypothetical protein